MKLWGLQLLLHSKRTIQESIRDFTYSIIVLTCRGRDTQWWGWETRLQWLHMGTFSRFKLTAQNLLISGLLYFCCLYPRLKCSVIEYCRLHPPKKKNLSYMVLKLSDLDTTMLITFRGQHLYKSTKWLVICKYNLSQPLELKSILNVVMSLEKWVL